MPAIPAPESRAQAPAREPAVPAAFDDLAPAERLLVTGLRATALGRGDCPGLAQAFDDACGAAGPAALQSQFVLVKLLGVGARRVIKVHAPGCPCVGADEAAVAGLAAAAQAALRDNDDALLRLRIGFLARPQYAESLRRTALALAEALTAAGLVLPVRLEPPAAVASGPRPLH